MLGYPFAGHCAKDGTIAGNMPRYAADTSVPVERSRAEIESVLIKYGEVRQRWRALLLTVKAKLEAVECGISTLEQEFLAFIVLPNSMTLGDWIMENALPQIRSGRRNRGAAMTHIWFWRKRLPERKGSRCRVLARGKMNSILVEFEDGWKVVTSRYAVRKTRGLVDRDGRIEQPSNER